MHELDISTKINKNVDVNIEINVNIYVTEKGDSFGCQCRSPPIRQRRGCHGGPWDGMDASRLVLGASNSCCSVAGLIPPW
jgi:hypothetical protein